ncbi:RNA polymerase sigma factor [Gryllotalpicola reticulitermitis]|uniref:RNA polymerase sigma factor n=1 Tax=Gryllotalpicola reticulitermitis TaxID=1184153 RepID=A0ABV8Q7S8_9MICO
MTDAARAVAAAHEAEWTFVLAAAARVAGDLDVAEDCVQDAYAQALVHWERSGVPAKPGAWLTTVATRRALELRRRAQTVTRKLPLLVPDPVEELPGADVDEAGFPDERLRLVFTCCHPALAAESRIALTLRFVCGLRTREVARALLVSETTMQARITRAKKKIAATGIPYRVPSPGELPERVASVLDVVHLVYTSGHTAASGAELTHPELAERGIGLARMLHALLPAEGEAASLLALLLLSEARRTARTDAAGALVLLEDQDRALWDRAQIAEGQTLVEGALRRPPVGRYGLLAAIAALHDEAENWEATDWPQILALYDLLFARWPSPVVALNRAVALSFAKGPAAALAAVDELAEVPALAAYPYLTATRADLLRRLGQADAAADAYREALLLTANEVEAAFLQRRLSELT